MYVLICGRLSLIHENADGNELIAQTLVPGDAFGELGLLDGQRCPATIRANIHSEVAHVPRCVILRCLEENPSAAVELLRLVTDRLCGLQQRIAEIALTTVYQRVAGILVENVATEEGDHVVQIGTEQIALTIASSREMVSRVIGKMIDEGLVRRPRPRRLLVLDVERLRSCAGLASRGR